MSIVFDNSQRNGNVKGRLPVGSVVEIDSSLPLIERGDGTVWFRSGEQSLPSEKQNYYRDALPVPQLEFEKDDSRNTFKLGSAADAYKMNSCDTVFKTDTHYFALCNLTKRIYKYDLTGAYVASVNVFDEVAKFPKYIAPWNGTHVAVLIAGTKEVYRFSQSDLTLASTNPYTLGVDFVPTVVDYDPIAGKYVCMDTGTGQGAVFNMYFELQGNLPISDRIQGTTYDPVSGRRWNKVLGTNDIREVDSEFQPLGLTTYPEEHYKSDLAGISGVCSTPFDERGGMLLTDNYGLLTIVPLILGLPQYKTGDTGLPLYVRIK